MKYDNSDSFVWLLMPMPFQILWIGWNFGNGLGVIEKGQSIESTKIDSKIDLILHIVIGMALFYSSLHFLQLSSEWTRNYHIQRAIESYTSRLLLSIVELIAFKVVRNFHWLVRIVLNCIVCIEWFIFFWPHHRPWMACLWSVTFCNSGCWYTVLKIWNGLLITFFSRFCSFVCTQHTMCAQEWRKNNRQTNKNKPFLLVSRGVSPFGVCVRAHLQPLAMWWGAEHRHGNNGKIN